MLYERRKSVAYKLFAFICVFVLSLVMFHAVALAEFSASNLNGRWSCFYAYDENNGYEIKDKMYYTFYDTFDNEGKFIFENQTKGTITHGTFSIGDGIEEHSMMLSLFQDGFQSIYDTEDMYAYYSLTCDDPYTIKIWIEDYYAFYYSKER